MQTITKVELQDEEQEVFDLEVKTMPFFFASGVMVHNCRRQYTSYDYLTKIMGEDPEVFLSENFQPEEIAIVKRQVALTAYRVKPYDFGPAKAAWEKDNDLNNLVITIYGNETEE